MIRDLRRFPGLGLVVVLVLSLLLGSLWFDRFLAELGVDPVMKKVQWFFLGVLGVGYGVLRAGMFHPGLNLGYGRWLAASPWTQEKPLPAGPVRLAWEDGVVVSALMLLAGGLVLAGGTDAFLVYTCSIPLRAFLITYVALLCAASLESGRYVPGYAFLFAAPLFFSGVANVYIAVAAVLVVYAVWSFDFRAWIGDGTWPDVSDRPQVKERKQAMAKGRGAKEDVVGWPYRELLRMKNYPIQRVPVAAVHGLLAVWWCYGFGKVNGESMMEVWHMVLVVLLPFLRLVAYMIQHHPPISLAGRIVTGRWVIPDYDRVWLAPVLLVGVGVLLPKLLKVWVASEDLVYGVSMFVILVGALACRPTLYEWRLTGAHRMVTVSPNQPIVVRK